MSIVYTNLEVYEDPYTVVPVLEPYKGLCDGCDRERAIVAFIEPVGTTSVSVPFVCADCRDLAQGTPIPE